MAQQEVERRCGTRLAARLSMGLKDVKRLAELAYYHEGRRQGLKLREIAELMGVSAPKVSLLSRQFKAHFAEAEVAQGLHRRILMLLWAEPMTRQALGRALEAFEDGEVDGALEALIKEGRAKAIEGRTTRYALDKASHRMVGGAWLARLDGLRNMMASVATTVERRMIDGDPRAFARSIQLDVLPEDIPRLKSFYEEALFPLLSDLNERAGRDEGAVTMHISILWAPEDTDAEEKNEP